MKTKQLFQIILLIFFSLTTNAQEKINEKAIELTKEFNLKLGEEKLSTEQESKMIILFIEKQNEVKKVKKEIIDEEQQKLKIKELHKLYSKKISEEILNEKQKAALKEYNKNKKE